MNDLELLRQFTQEGSQAAFSALVGRHVELVYSAALRQVRSPDLAREVAQTVFLELSAGARKLRPDTHLASWLYVATRRTAVDLIRREIRRQKWELTADELGTMKPSDLEWSKLETVLDEAIGSLDAVDRQAILLRFFENQSLADVGRALGASDDAAQKRVSRALERLRLFFANRGVATTAAVLATAISTHAVQPAPHGMAVAISAAALSSGTAATVVARGAARTFFGATAQKVAIAAIMAGALGFLAFQVLSLRVQEQQIAALKSRSTRLRDEARLLRQQRDRVRTLEAALSAGTGAFETGDLEFDARIRALLARVAAVRKRLQQDPVLQIPELQFLSEFDWIDALQECSRLETEEDFRRALSLVRRKAKDRFVPKLQAALKLYLRDSKGELPASVAQLASHFDPPVESALLDRYEMRATGQVEALSNYETEMIVEKLSAIIDRQYDTQEEIGPNQRATLLNPDPADALHIVIETEEDLRKYNEVNDKLPMLSDARTQSLGLFRAAHHGAYPNAASELAPYFQDPDLRANYLEWKKWDGQRY